jgi:hypothetical protein
LLLTGVDEARKWTIWMMANIGQREAIRVKYVLNARKNSHGSIVWKRRRRRRRGRRRPGSRICCVARFAVHAATFFDSTFFFFPFFLGSLPFPRPLAQTPPPKTPPPLSLTPLLLLCPWQTPCAQHPPLLRCSTRPAPRTLTEAHTSRRRVASERHTSECRASRRAASKRLNVMASSPTRGVL